MGTRVILVRAGPTPWDAEGRIVGSRPLPLTAEAIDDIRRLVSGFDFTVENVYRAAGNEACDLAAKLIAEHYELRPRNSAELEEVGLGLWEGLTPEDMRARYPTVFPQWMEKPLSVTPPDGEPVAEAMSRISAALRRILRRNRGSTVALALRPMAMQIAAGLLHSEKPEQIAGHLHEQQSAETIDLRSDEPTSLA